VVDLRQQITEHRIATTRLSARLEVLSERLDQRRASLQRSPDRTLARLRRRKSTTKELFVSLSKSLQRAQVAEESTPEQASIIQRAGPPSTPIAPEVWSKVLLATLLGGVGGCGLVLIYDRFDDIVEAPDDLERSPNELFGAIPEWDPEMVPASDTGRSDWPGIASPFSPAAEAYRHVATNVRLGLPHSVTTLLVTSPGAREGKTTTVANLGVALSESGRDVLLVDADLQGPTLHKLFGGERAPGLTDRLADVDEGLRLLHAPEEENGRGRVAPDRPGGDAQTFLHRTQQQQMGRLGLLPAGTEVPQPALLLQESHVEPQLQSLTEQWDVVLFDTPPALLYDDTFRLAALSDLVLLLAAAGDTHRSAFRDVRTRLETVCPHSVTALLNRHRPSPNTTYGYTSYSYPSTREDRDRSDRWLRHVKRGVRRVVKG
jgi:Mrp family chromosome partitioning ATPase